MATAQQSRNSERESKVISQKSIPSKLTASDKQERLDALKIVPQWDTVTGLKRQRFNESVEKYRSAASAEKEAKEAKDQASKDIVAALSAVGLDKVMYGELPVTLVTGCTAAKLDPKVLYQLGVSSDVIAKATTLGHEYTYAKVTEPKQG